MAEQISRPLVAPEMIPKFISGRFFPNGTSTSALTFVGKGVASVVRTASAGVFTVTLLENFAQLISATATVQHTTAADLVAQFGAFSNLGTSTACSFTIRVLAGATGTDITANADSSVFFQLVFNDSGVQ